MSDRDQNKDRRSPDPSDFVTDPKTPNGKGIDCSGRFVGVEDLVVVTGTSRGQPAQAMMLMLDTHHHRHPDPGGKDAKRQTLLQMLSF